MWKNAGPPQNFPGPQSNVTGQQGWNSATPGVHVNIGSHHAKRGADANTGGLKDKVKSARATGNPLKTSTVGPKRGLRAVVESSEYSDSETTSDSEEEILEHGPAANSAGPGQQTRRSNRRKREVKYNEESDDEDIEDDDSKDEDGFENAPSYKRLKKSSAFHGDDSHETARPNEKITAHNGPVNGVNYCSNTVDERKGGAPFGNKTSDGIEKKKKETIQAGESNDCKEKVFHSVSNSGLSPDTDDASDDEKIICVDPEFFYFGQLRDVNKFQANRIWAVYDDQGCMPRFYARITKVKTTPKFMVHFTWLEFNPTNKVEAAWYDGGLPVACGHFKHGKSETSKETAMFSRAISFEKGKTSKSYEIYPRRGEVWALFKGWNIGWSSDADNHKNYQFEVVQVVSDLTTSTSIIVMPLVKIKGFVSLFLQSRESAPYVIPQSDTLRFSHCVPHHLMTRNEREGILEGSIELDPASLPLNLEEGFPSVDPECDVVRSQESSAKYAGSSSENISCKGSMSAC
ncbi:hypothetical protein ACP4OV_029015 [Aristida adscensionis]